MNLASLQTITWGTVTAAVCSALLLASVGAEQRPTGLRHAPQRTQLHGAENNTQPVAPELAEAAPVPAISAEVPATP